MFRLIVIILAFGTLSQCHQRQSRQIIRNYQYETVYPASRNYLEGAYNHDHSPWKLSKGVRLKPLQLRQPLPLPPTQFDFRGKYSQPAFLPANLFTPNTIEQPAETQGQIDEYRKALDEEEREAQGEGSRPVWAATTEGSNFISVKSKDYNYNYRIWCAI